MVHFKNLSITTKFILLFLIISFVPLIAAIYISYNISCTVLREEVTRNLFVVADNKANQIESYLLRQKNNGSSLAYTPEIIDAVDRFATVFGQEGIDSPTYSGAEQELKPMVAYYQKLFDYEDIFFINPEGFMIFSAQGKKEPRSLYEIAMTAPSELASLFVNVKSSQEIKISNFEYLPDTKKAGIFIAIPVFKASNLVGIVVFQISNKKLYEFIGDYTGLGNTGETIVASKIGDEAVFVTPIRFDPAAEFSRRIKLGSKGGYDIQNAVCGNNGSGIFTDYRKHKVLAVWRYLSNFQLGMVVKMDVAEALALASRLRNTLLSVGFLLIMIVVFAAVAIAHSISTPIMELTNISKKIYAGNLSARAKVYAEDEIGELTQSFNYMTDNLVEARLRVEQKNAEVEEQKRLLEVANKELDNFVYTVSHDLRAPLRGIDGFAGFLEQDYADRVDEQGKDYLRRIRTNVNRMKTLIDDLLTLSKISRIKNPYEDVDMNELIKSIIARVEFDIKKYNVELVIPKGLPIVRCDRIKMGEVFLNLTSNAVKFSSKNKGFNPRVEVGYNERNDAHEFYVKDNGIGIHKKHQGEIFEIFKRLHSQNEYEGTGAGLSIVKRVIDDHQGSVWVDSELGKGATFYFTIPKKIKETNVVSQNEA